MMLPKPVMSAIHERGGNINFRYGSACVNGFRENMEDAHLTYFKDNWAFFGVFDGHVNDHCSAYLEKEWHEVLQTLPVPITDDKMKEVTLAVDKKYIDDNPTGGSTGTFFIAMREGDDFKLQIGNVGDSRVLVCKDGACHAMTQDHKPMNEEERRRIEACKGYVENGRVNGSLAISRAFGDVDYKRNAGGQLDQQVIPLPDVTHITIPANTADYAVLACDGVFEGQFSNEEVIEFVSAQLQHEQDLAIVSNRVCEEAIKRGSKDNISCVVVQFKNGTNGTNDGIIFVPGPFAAPGHGGFRKAYMQMATKGGVTPAQCIEQRYDTLAALPQHQLDAEQSNELSVFTGGPPDNLSGAARTEWFAGIIHKLEGTSGGAPDASTLMQMYNRGVPLSALVQKLQEGNDVGGK
jgi:protein phosphatase